MIQPSLRPPYSKGRMTNQEHMLIAMIFLHICHQFIFKRALFKSYSLSFKKEFPKIFFRDKIIDAEDKSVPSFYLEILFDTFQAWKFYNIFSTKTRRVAETLLDIAESLFSILQNQISSLKQCLSEFVT